MQRNRTTAAPRGFTVIELLVVIAIIALLAAMAASALSNAAEQARAQRTEAIINKIDQLIMERWDGFRTRAVPYQAAPNETPLVRAQNRLNALRELQRMELPDRKSDIVNLTTGNTMEITASGVAQSSVFRGYFRRVNAWTSNNPANWTTQYQGAECLYLILSSMRDGDQSALEYFTSAEIGDVDEDGMPEILDGWGQPIEFLRWAPGHVGFVGPDGQWGVAGTDDDGDGTTDNISEALWAGSDDRLINTMQVADGKSFPDPFDPLKVDGVSNYALKPLVFSAGSDGEYEVNVNVQFDTSKPPDDPMRYTASSPPNDPYVVNPSHPGLHVGAVGDLDGDGYHGWTDNITNHYRGE